MIEETALPPHTIAPATADDMPFISDAVQRLRLDGEWPEPKQFIVVRRQGSDDDIVAFGRIKPYRETYELGSVAVMEEERNRGWGRLVVRALIDRFPQDEVFITTDLRDYFERLGFLRTDIVPQEVEDKVGRVCDSLRSGVVGMVYDRRIGQRPPWQTSTAPGTPSSLT